MNNNKTGFVFHFDNYPILISLPLEQRGLLITLLCSYADQVWRTPGLTLEELLPQFPQLSGEALVACRFMAASIARDTQRWLSQRDYWLSRRQGQGEQDAPAPKRRAKGPGPGPARPVVQETPEEYQKRLAAMAQLARQA